VTWVVWSAATAVGTHTSRWPESDPAEVASMVTHEWELAGMPDVVVSAEVMDKGRA
jgi:hypothetical protein